MSSALSPRVVFLGSGSSGNATVVSDGETSILIDCGFSAREVSRRLAEAGIESGSIAAVFVTHEHGDHIRGVDVFCRRHAHDCALYATAGTLRAGRFGSARERCVVIKPGEAMSVGGLGVVPFRTSHDASEPVGFRVTAAGVRIGLVSDTGTLTGEAREALSGCSVLGIECNHDERMLHGGPYPYHLKRRISSNLGHLSNEAAADALDELVSGKLQQVFALHRSRTNNTAVLASLALERRLSKLGLNVPVTVTAQDSVSDSSPPQQTLFDATTA